MRTVKVFDIKDLYKSVLNLNILGLENYKFPFDAKFITTNKLYGPRLILPNGEKTLARYFKYK